MFKYKNPLNHYDEKGYPYSMEFVKESFYENFHGNCSKEGFAIVAEGAKHLFVTPRLKNFKFKIKVELSPVKAPFKNLNFAVMMGYDRLSREGYEIGFRYEYEIKTLFVALIKLDGTSKEIVSELSFKDVTLKYREKLPLEINVSGNDISGGLAKYKFEFSENIDKGRIGLDVSSVAEKIVFADAVITSDDEIDKKQIFSQKHTLPKLNGGVLPYSLKMDVFELDEKICNIKLTLDGGANALEKRDLHSNSWTAYYDDIKNLYIKLYRNKEAKKYYLFNGTSRFKEISMRKVFSDFQEVLFDIKEAPLKVEFFAFDFCPEELVGIGYEYMESLRYHSFGGSSECVFDRKNQLVYAGEPLETDAVISLKSVDKKIVEKIPITVYDYSAAVNFAENNHFFFTDEQPKFEVDIFTDKDAELVKVKTTLLDAFFDKLKNVKMSELSRHDFEVNGYSKYKSAFKLPKLSCGVYHILTEVFYGDKVIGSLRTAFEVMDESSEISPQKASGLPDLHVGDGDGRVPDFYAEAKSHNWAHYCEIAQHRPIVSEDVKLWELLRVYGRKLFIWATDRTLKDYDLSKVQNVMANAEYINYYLPKMMGFKGHTYRYDYFDFYSYNDRLKELLTEFLSSNNKLREKLGLENVFEDFTKEKHVALLKECGGEWIAFCLPRIHNDFIKQSEEIRKNNPGFKRVSYGPWSPYYSNYIGAYGVKWYGFDIEKLHEIFDGFMQLEDYPYSSAYRTTKCAWSIKTIKLLNSKLIIRPELYFNFPDGCPDHAVVCAYPPYGGSHCPPHFTMTQICEYVYGSAHYKNGRFDYWRDGGFAPFSFLNPPEKRAESIISTWKYVRENRPVKPKKCPVFLYDINPEEDRYDYHIARNHFYNISEANLAYMYDLMKTAGIPEGFATKFEDVLSLSEKDVDCIVLPDMTRAAEAVKEKIRNLHKKGVTLIAVSRLAGLEDLFGVTEKKTASNVNCLTDGENMEYITPNSAEFFHKNNGGKVVLTTGENIPVVIEGENTLLLNTAVSQVGIDALCAIEYQGRPNISRILRKTLKKSLLNILKPEICAEDGIGIILTETEKDETVMVVTDYSPYSQQNTDIPSRKEVRFNCDGVSEVAYLPVTDAEIDLGKIVSGNKLKGITFMIRPQETLIFKLK